MAYPRPVVSDTDAARLFRCVPADCERPLAIVLNGRVPITLGIRRIIGGRLTSMASMAASDVDGDDDVGGSTTTGVGSMAGVGGDDIVELNGIAYLWRRSAWNEYI